MSRVISLLLTCVLLVGCGANIPDRTTPTPPPSPSPTAEPTPLADLSAFVGMGGFPLVTRTPVGDIAANVRVGIVTADGDSTYTLVTEDGRLAFGVSASQVRVADSFVLGAATPAPLFASYRNAEGYPLLTQFNVGAIAANERVRISSVRRGANGWLYTIVPDDEQRYEEVPERALRSAE